MEVYIPVAEFGGFGPWSHRGGPRCSRGGRGGFGLEHPFAFGGRGGCGSRGSRGGPRSFAPRHMRFALNDMDMDNWISPADVIGAIFGPPEQQQQAKTSANEVAPTTPANSTSTAVANKNVFEVKLNVADYKPETLSVKVENGVITVEGKYEETKTEKDEQGKEVISEEFVSRHFKRCFTIPENAIEEKLECKMTADGNLILSAPLKAIEPAPEPAVRSIPINMAATAVAVAQEPQNKDKEPAPENTTNVEAPEPTPTAPMEMEVEKTN